MKKLLLILLCLPMMGFGQTVNDIPIKDIDVKYVQIVGTSKLISTKLNIRIDFGQETKFWSGGIETFVKDANGKGLDFNSMIDALNFMYANGYEFETAYAITIGNQNVYHYLLRKKDYSAPPISLLVPQNTENMKSINKLEARKIELKKLYNSGDITKKQYEEEINKMDEYINDLKTID